MRGKIGFFSVASTLGGRTAVGAVGNIDIEHPLEQLGPADARDLVSDAGSTRPPNFRFMANYVKVPDLKGGDFNGAEPDAFMLRAQAYW